MPVLSRLNKALYEASQTSMIKENFLALEHKVHDALLMFYAANEKWPTTLHLYTLDFYTWCHYFELKYINPRHLFFEKPSVPIIFSKDSQYLDRPYHLELRVRCFDKFECPPFVTYEVNS